MSSAVHERIIDETPIAIIDFETTGLSAGGDRVLEMSIVRMDPGDCPKLILDTLVNPRRPVAATEIHGITDGDVADAPTFPEIAGAVARALAGCMVASYNVYFDMPFLRYELSAAGLDAEIPHMCLMYLRPMLGLGSRCSLSDACRQHSIALEGAHMASADAMASAGLMQLYRGAMKEQHVRTFADLAALKSYKFTGSFAFSPLSDTAAAQFHSSSSRFKSRCVRFQPSSQKVTTPTIAPPQPVNPLADYWDALVAVLADLTITESEVGYLLAKKQQLGLSTEHVRALHARAFSKAIGQFIDDRVLDDRECRILQRLHRCLSELGWAPGDA